jgi:hypothetical protein
MWRQKCGVILAFICLFFRDYNPALPVVQYLKIIISYILFSFLLRAPSSVLFLKDLLCVKLHVFSVLKASFYLSHIIYCLYRVLLGTLRHSIL